MFQGCFMLWSFQSFICCFYAFIGPRSESRCQLLFLIIQHVRFRETTVYRKTVYRTDSWSKRKFIEFFKTKYQHFLMDTGNAFNEFYYTHQKRFKCTNAKSLSNFIKPNNSVLNAHTQLFCRILSNPISPAFWITYTMRSTNFIEPNTSVVKCTHTLSLLKFVELNTSVLNAHTQWVYLNLLNKARSPRERVSKRLQSLTETKTRCNVFATVSEVPIGCIPPNGDINFNSRPSQNSTLITLTCYKHCITYLCRQRQPLSQFNARQTFVMVAQYAFSVASKDPSLFLMAQF